MDGQHWVVLILLLTPALIILVDHLLRLIIDRTSKDKETVTNFTNPRDGKIKKKITKAVYVRAWRTSQEERRLAQDLRRNRGDIHFHSKRHMLPNEADTKRRDTIQRSRDIRKKPSGHLTPLQEDDMDNEEVVSVAIGPPPMRPKYDKINWKHPPKAPVQNTSNCSQGATNLVKDVLTQLGREFLTHDVNEDFVFGQYIGNIMRNLTRDLKLRMQHEILELVVKYQRLNRGEPIPKGESSKEMKVEKKFGAQNNDTDEGWPDFSNLAKIVG